MYNLNKNCQYIWFCNDLIQKETTSEGRELYFVEFTTENPEIKIHTKLSADIIHSFNISTPNDFCLNLLTQKIDTVPTNQPLKISWSYNTYNVPFFEGIVISTFKENFVTNSIKKEIYIDNAYIDTFNQYYKIVELDAPPKVEYWMLEKNSDVFQLYVFCGTDGGNEGSFCPGWYAENNFVPISGKTIQLKLLKNTTKENLEIYKKL